MSQNTMNILLFIGGVEIFLLMFCLCIVLLWKGSSRKKHDQKIIAELVNKIKQDDDSRRDKLVEVFSECYDMEEEELNTVVDEFIKRERAFYKTMISVYVNHDTDEFVKLTGILEEVVKPYPDLALSSELTNREELEKAMDANEVLQEENTNTKKVLDELIDEYSRSFDKDNEGVTPEAIKGITQEKNICDEFTEDSVEELTDGSEVAQNDSDKPPADHIDDMDLVVDVAEEEITQVQDDDLDLLVEDLPETSVAEESVVETSDDELDLLVEDSPETSAADEPVVDTSSEEFDLLVEDSPETKEPIVEVSDDELDLLVEDLPETSVADEPVVGTPDEELDLAVEDSPETPSKDKNLPVDTGLAHKELTKPSSVKEMDSGLSNPIAIDEQGVTQTEVASADNSEKATIANAKDELDLFIEEIDEAQVVNKTVELEQEESTELDIDMIKEPVAEAANIDLDLITEVEAKSAIDLEAIIGSLDDELGVDELKPEDDEDDELDNELEALLK